MAVAQRWTWLAVRVKFFGRMAPSCNDADSISHYRERACAHSDSTSSTTPAIWIYLDSTIRGPRLHLDLVIEEGPEKEHDRPGVVLHHLVPREQPMPSRAPEQPRRAGSHEKWIQ